LKAGTTADGTTNIDDKVELFTTLCAGTLSIDLLIHISLSPLV